MTRVAVVTGAARGVGAATVRRLAGTGWAVVAIDRASDDRRLPYAMGTREELDALAVDHPGVVPVVADTCDEAAMRSAVGTAEERFGGVDAVLAVAGVIAGGVPLWEMPADQLDAVLDVDLRGAIVAARTGIPVLLRRGEPRDGRFVAVASAAGRRGLPRLAAYCAAKAGVGGLVRALAMELQGTGITANAVSPGSTATPILDESARLYGLASTADFAARQPVGRLLDPDEVAAAIAWLAGPESAAMTGADVAVDGGMAV